MIKSIWILLLLTVSSGWSTLVAQQDNVRHQAPVALERYTEHLLEFDVPGVVQDQVLEALLFTRPADRSSFEQQEARFENGRVRFPVEISSREATGIEYYFMLRLTDGSQITWPNVNEDESPVHVTVIDPETVERPLADFIDYTILSPQPGRALGEGDVLIAVALFYDDEDVEDGNFRILINEEDVTEEAEISPFVIKYIPEESSEGEKSVMILFEQGGEEFEVSSWNYRFVPGQEISFGEYAPVQNRPPSGSLELGARNQEISGMNNDALNGRLRISGQRGHWEYSLNGYMTSQEDRRLQPQSRYSFEMRYGPWLELQIGDTYPMMSDLTITGRRVRGLNSRVSLFGERLEAQFIVGDMNRAINNIYSPIEVEPQFAGDQQVGTNYTLGFEEGGRGTFSQKLIGGRLAFGHRDRFRFAIHGFKVEDDTTSILVLDDFNKLTEFQPELERNLTLGDRGYLTDNPDELIIEGSNPRPRGNLVLGSELSFSMDNQRIRFKSEGGMSLLNMDISEGPLNQQRAEELGLDLDVEIENVIDRLSWLIIINEQMSTLPFRFQENETGDLELEPFFPTSILANDSRLHLNYFDHQLQMRYQWVGPDYQTLANSTIRRDVSGFTVMDRFRLFENRIYVTLGYEALQNNLLGVQNATTHTNTMRSGISWFPIRSELPRISLSSSLRTRDNQTEPFNPWLDGSPEQVIHAAIRNYQIAGEDTLTAARPRLRETLSLNGSVTQNFNLFDLSHQANVNYGVTQTDDRYFLYGESESRNFSIRLTSRFDDLPQPFRLRLGYIINRSESGGGLSDVKIHGFDLGAETFLMENKLTLNGELAFTRNRFSSLSLVVNDNNNPDFTGDNYYVPADESERSRRHTNAFIIRVNAQYDFTTNHALLASANLTNVSDPLGNLGAMPNDRILHLRYIFRF
ncbi:MAG: hypothetical protein WDZ29_03160 [Balneolaceae bacterium]